MNEQMTPRALVLVLASVGGYMGEILGLASSRWLVPYPNWGFLLSFGWSALARRWLPKTAKKRDVAWRFMAVLYQTSLATDWTARSQE